MPREPLSSAVRDLLWAIDGGYFADPFLPKSAYVSMLRAAYEAETGRTGYPREERPADVVPTPLRPAAIFDALASMNAAQAARHAAE